MNNFGKMIKDPGDLYDEFKWDFPEDDLTVVIIDGYIYKVNKDNANKRAAKLHNIRQKINKICDNLVKFSGGKNFSEDMQNKIELFLDIHYEFERSPHDTINLAGDLFPRIREGRETSKYLLSEIPKGSKVGSQFNGINKPRARAIFDNVPSIGEDGQGRACYRDVLIKHNLAGKELKDLILHEVAHGFVNHIQWRDNDHGPPFQEAEALLKKMAKNIQF